MAYRLKSRTVFFIVALVVSATAQNDTLGLLNRVVACMRTLENLVPLDSIQAGGRNLLDNNVSIVEKEILKASHRRTTLSVISGYARPPEGAVDSSLRATGTRIIDVCRPSLKVISMIANSEPVIKRLEIALGSAEERSKLLWPVDELAKINLDDSRKSLLLRLHKYECKYGPASPRLNLVESFLNYTLQFVPGFSPTVNGPNRFELIASYSTSYLIVYKPGDEVQSSNDLVVSLFEAGLRCYIFDTNWGVSNSLKGIIKPGYFSIGFCSAGEWDGVLRNPFNGRIRPGAFLSWGSIKAAYIYDKDNARILISRQFQIVPYFF